jgi:hypothetical protein
LKKPPPKKVDQKYSTFFSPIAANTAQKQELMFKKMAYRLTALHWRKSLHALLNETC